MHTNIKLASIIKIPRISFLEYAQWNVVFIELAFNPRGFDDPVWCKNMIWTADKAAIINGTRKWIAKNRFNVALSTAKPPHNHWTIGFPIYGIAENKLVITVAPQNLI
jgi:hypothetical protein